VATRQVGHRLSLHDWRAAHPGYKALCHQNLPTLLVAWR
jgi:hypothetical protein